jgi:hypothetical protein
MSSPWPYKLDKSSCCSYVLKTAWVAAPWLWMIGKEWEWSQKRHRGTSKCQACKASLISPATMWSRQHPGNS